MATNLSVDITLPLRSFELKIALEVGGSVALLGPSGAGKTSLLHAIAGLARPREGRIALDDEVWLDTERGVSRRPDRRRVGLVFQEYALFAHMTVRENVAYGGRERVQELLERFGIAALADARPPQLSGGERQRVALARALARNPGVLLLDEPLAALDAPTRARVRAELVELLRDLALPTLIVTHDYQDAVALADKVGVIAWGRLRQLAGARELIARPQDTFVASFTGANVLPGVASATAGPLTSVRLSDGAVIHSADRLRGEVAVVVYPWEVQVTRAAPSDAALNVLPGELRGLVQMPSSVRVSVGLLTAELSPANAALLDTQSGGSGYSVFRVADTRLLATG